MFDQGYFDSYSFIYNSLDILIIIPIHVFILCLLWCGSKTRIFVLRAAFYRAYINMWHCTFLSVFLKILLGLFINFYIFLPYGTSLDKFTVFLLVYFSVTLVVLCGWYFWAIWYVIK